MELSARRLEQREMLLTAAYDLVADVGIEGLRTREIAKKAGLNLGIFHYCFGSKDDLLRALYQYIVARFRAETYHFSYPDQTPRQRIEGFLRLRIYIARHMSRDVKVWRSFQGLADTNESVREILQQHFNTQRGAIAEILRLGMESGDFHGAGVEPEVAAALIVSLQNGLTMQLGLEPDAFDPEAYNASVVEIFLGSRGNL
jgi:AcrR family transcriptional regulator